MIVLGNQRLLSVQLLLHLQVRGLQLRVVRRGVQRVYFDARQLVGNLSNLVLFCMNVLRHTYRALLNVGLLHTSGGSVRSAAHTVNSPGSSAEWFGHLARR